MALIDILLKKARALCNEILEAMYSDNEDEFIEALGLNPKDYEIVSNDAVVGCDDIAALATACGAWDE